MAVSRIDCDSGKAIAHASCAWVAGLNRHRETDSLSDAVTRACCECKKTC